LGKTKQFFKKKKNKKKKNTYPNKTETKGDSIDEKNYFKYKDFITIKKINKKKIRFYGVNLFDKKVFKRHIKILLKNKFTIKFDKNNPDYLFFNVFGNEELDNKYKNSIKIAYFTENTIPDFFQCDYSIGHAHINYLDRYFKFPFSFIWTLKKVNFDNLIEIRNNAIKNPRKKFCAAVISDIFPEFNDFFRLEFIKKLNKYKIVDMGGRYNNTVGGPVQNKIKFLSNYKFSIAMENSKGDGYSTEKIIDSFFSGTIPIYYGDYMVDEYINPKSFILIMGEIDLEQKIEYIKKIDNNDELYRRIMKEEVFINKKIKEDIEKEQSNFLIHIFSQDKDKAKRI